MVGIDCMISAQPTDVYSAMTGRQSVGWCRALDVVVGVTCLLLVTTSVAFTAGPSSAEAAATQWTGDSHHHHHHHYDHQQSAGLRQRGGGGGCVGSRLCCPGKNSSCRVEGPRASDRASRTCYCDTECLTTRDCCADMQRACNISTSVTPSFLPSFVTRTYN